MARVKLNSADFVDATDASASDGLLTKNWQTTAAVGLTVASGGAAGMIMLGAFPAQTLAVAGSTAALAYAGHRRANGLEVLPFGKTSTTDDTTTTNDTATADDAVVEPAAA